ncbi:MAG: MarR family transcriptional regulator, partial [Microbacterium sp.]
MTHSQTVQDLIFASNTLTRVAAIETRNETPSAQWRTLVLLREHGPLRIGELARLSRTTQPGITRLIGGMVEAGLVTREQDSDDSRAVVIAVTERGLQAYDQWCTELVAALLPRFEGLNEDEWRALTMTAEILMLRIGQVDKDAQREDT